MKIIYTLTLFLFLFLVFPVIVALAQVDGQGWNEDKIRIVNVSTSSPLRSGVVTEFIVEIEYTLNSIDEAELYIAFNRKKLKTYETTSKYRIEKGTHFITAKASTIPKNWKSRGDFIVFAAIVPLKFLEPVFEPLAKTKEIIKFEH